MNNLSLFHKAALHHHHCSEENGDVNQENFEIKVKNELHLFYFLKKLMISKFILNLILKFVFGYFTILCPCIRACFFISSFSNM